MINGLPCLIDLLSQAVSLIRSHFFAFVEAGGIFVHAMSFIHVMAAIGFPCMLAAKGTLLGPVHMISGLRFFMPGSAGVRRI